MPWVRLHATKDYVDMVKRLEEFPTIHQTFNLVPCLIDQLEAYLPPHHRSDLFLDYSRKPAAQLSDQEQRFLLQWFFLANVERMIRPYARYHDLFVKRGVSVRDDEWPAIQKRFTVQDYLDLQVWFNLVWIDPWLRSQDVRLSALLKKESRFSEEEKQYVLAYHLFLIGQVIPAYRAAAEHGQIELSTSPYYHPILPLLWDQRAARKALPMLPLPEKTFRAPEEARWHVEAAIKRHKEVFGQLPQGMWPAEGSVSQEIAQLFCEVGIRWIATDEEILWRTLNVSRNRRLLYQPHQVRHQENTLNIIFRDHELADLIGFVYSRWDPQQAAADFMRRLGEIHHEALHWSEPALVSIILDGENAWESYPHDGHEFLMALYHALAKDQRFRCVTVNEFLQAHPPQHTQVLPELFSGSWIDANFSTWIGHPEKNAAWRQLTTSYEAFSTALPGSVTDHRAWMSLRMAEGSDWMWWFGDTHVSAQAEEFDRLFRLHITNGYQFAQLPFPDELFMPIRSTRVSSISEPTAMIRPTLDGRESSYYEWLYAGHVTLRQQ